VEEDPIIESERLRRERGKTTIMEKREKGSRGAALARSERHSKPRGETASQGRTQMDETNPPHLTSGRLYKKGGEMDLT